MADAERLSLVARAQPVRAQFVPVEEGAVVTRGLEGRQQRRVELAHGGVDLRGGTASVGDVGLGPVEAPGGLHQGFVAAGPHVGQQAGHHVGDLAARRFRRPKRLHLGGHGRYGRVP